MTGAMKTYTVGIKLDSKESYDRLMNEYSKESTGIILTGLDFKNLFEGYPEGYPCLVEYLVDTNPMGPFLSMQIKNLIDAGYKVIINKEEP